MKAKHTPGPWIINDNAVFSPSKTICFLPAQLVDVPAQRKEIEQQEANALLIAVAPDLLEACKEALTFIEAYEHTHGREFRSGIVLRQAVKKAKGN